MRLRHTNYFRDARWDNTGTSNVGNRVWDYVCCQNIDEFPFGICFKQWKMLRLKEMVYPPYD